MLAGPTGEAAKAGPIALLVILVLAVACYFLFRSMTRHLKKVRDEFPVDERDKMPENPAERPSDDADAANGRAEGTAPPTTNGTGRRTDEPPS